MLEADLPLVVNLEVPDEPVPANRAERRAQQRHKRPSKNDQ